MAKSILQNERYCYLCKVWYNLRTVRGLEEHHIFPAARGGLSERLGLKVWLCHAHHNEPPLGVHFDARAMRWLQDDARRAYDAVHGAGALDEILRDKEGGRNGLADLS